jgi:hypothetical protein
MRQQAVTYGSKVGNTTNPQYLEVDSWVRKMKRHYHLTSYMY